MALFVTSTYNLSNASALAIASIKSCRDTGGLSTAPVGETAPEAAPSDSLRLIEKGCTGGRWPAPIPILSSCLRASSSSSALTAVNWLSAGEEGASAPSQRWHESAMLRHAEYVHDSTKLGPRSRCEVR